MNKFKKQMNRDLENACTAYEMAVYDGGFSLDGNMKAPSTGYMVGGVAEEMQAPLQNTDECLCAIMYMWRMRDMVERFKEEQIWLRAEVYVGGWVEEDEHGVKKLVLDISENWADLEDAMVIARQRGERAIYDVTAGESLYVKDHQFKS
jgi:hypothetical protein